MNGVRCISKRLSGVLLSIAMVLAITGCETANIPQPFQADNPASVYSVLEGENTGFSDSFASDLCVINNDKTDLKIDMTGSESAGLFDLNHKQVLYGINVHKQMNPASLTKVMTALLALENCKLDDVITATGDVEVQEPGAQLCGLKEGDTLTVDQALYALLIYSGNDVAVAIADHVAGSVEEFSKMMNERVVALGATNSHFSNPHGLTASDHYTTAYDLYLIFNEARKWDKFTEIIHSTEYSTVYKDKAGNNKYMNFKSTNLLFDSESGYNVPSNITVIGGKTGTTEAAGACLILLSNDSAGNPYISVIMKSDSKNVLYTNMVHLLEGVSAE